MSSKLGSNLRSAMQHAKREAITHGSDGSQRITLEQLSLPAEQPRRHFDEQAMAELTASIKAKGMLQPMLVRPLGGERFELVAGERRYRAAKTLSLDVVPVLVRALTDAEAKEAALTENLQREDINPVEETEAILALLSLKLEAEPTEVISLLYARQNDEKGNSTHNVMGNETTVIDEFFATTGKMNWASFVTNRLPLLKLPNDVLMALRRGEIAYTKALLVARIKDAAQRRHLLKKVSKEGASVEQVRTWVKDLQATTEVPSYQPIVERVRRLPRLIKRSRALQNSRTSQRVGELIDELEKLLGTPS